MIETDVDHYPPRYASCSTVRITPYDAGRAPRHDQAHTYRVHSPLTFGYVLRYEWSTGRTPTRALAPYATLTVDTALGNDLFHHDQPVISNLRNDLYRDDVHAVELWSPDGWTYGLMPRWRSVYPDDWPCPDEPGTFRLATATIHPAYAADDWPIPGSTAELGSGTFLHWQVSANGPPPL